MIGQTGLLDLSDHHANLSAVDDALKWWLGVLRFEMFCLLLCLGSRSKGSRLLVRTSDESAAYTYEGASWSALVSKESMGSCVWATLPIVQRRMRLSLPGPCSRGTLATRSPRESRHPSIAAEAERPGERCDQRSSVSLHGTRV